MWWNMVHNIKINEKSDMQVNFDDTKRAYREKQIMEV